MAVKKLAALLLSAVLLLSASGCAPDAPPDRPVTLEELKPTGELNLFVSGDINVASLAAELFRERYPDVEVNIERAESQEYNEKLAAAIMAGEGPDVIEGGPWLFPDIYKVADAGTFADLTQLMAGDPEFRREEYVESVLDAGVIRGKQVLLPTDYSYNLFISEAGVLEKLGLSELAEERDYASFWEKMVDAVPLLKQSPNFETLAGIYNSNFLLYHSGLKLIDRETGELLPDREGLRAVSELCRKLVYEEQALPPVQIGTFFTDSDLYNGLRDGACAMTSSFSYGVDSFFFSFYGFVKALGTPVVIPSPSLYEGTSAQVTGYLGINANSPNQLNAWNFMKIYMSDEVRGQHTAPMSPRKSTQRKFIDERGVARLGVSAYLDLGIEAVISDEEFDGVLHLFQSVGHCEFVETALWEIYQEQMKPYFEGAGEYDACVEALETQLKIYLSE